MKWNNSILLFALSLTLTGCSNNEQSNSDHFGNKVYLTSEVKTSTILVRQNFFKSVTKTLSVAMPRPLDSDLAIVFEPDPNRVADYNETYYANAKELPEEFYEIPENEVVIVKGGVQSSQMSITFKDLDKLSLDAVYVLPVTVASAGGVDILQSARTHYYVIKAGALISLAGKIDRNFLRVAWNNAAVVNDLTSFTIEAFVRSHAWDRDIATLLGIEGTFLVRFGDAGYPAGQLQISSANRATFPAADKNKVLPLDEWVHIAVVVDAESGTVKIYSNGNVQSSGEKSYRVSFGTSDFYIGRSWNEDRYFPGEIAECRIWNVARTAAEIAENPYYVDPHSSGLVAYWKFDEGQGNTVYDQTGNGNDATADKPMVWVSVELPAMEDR